LNPSRANTESKTGNTHTIPPALTLPSRQNGLHQDGYPFPVAGEVISSLDTVPVLAVRPEVSQPQQQEMFIATIVEDISLQATLRLPVIVLTPGKQTLSEQRQVIASTAGSAAIAGAGDLIFAILRYLTNIVMTNVVSQSIYGIYVTVYTSATITGTIAELGLSNTMVRFLSTYHTKGEHGFATGLLRFVVWMTLVSGLLCGALFYLSATVLAHLVYRQDAYVLPLKEIALLVPLIALQLVLASGLQALKVFKWKVLVDRFIQPVLSLIFIGAFYLLGLRLEGLILATTCGFLASVMAGQILLRKASKQLVRDVAPRFEPKTWLRFALPMSLNSFILNVLNSTDVLFLAAFATAAQVGLYAAADRVSFLISMPGFALRVIFSPLIAEYYARGEHEQLASLARLVMKWIFTLSCPLCLCFYIFHDAILSIFSRGYTAAGMALIILSFGNLIGTGTSVTGNLLMMAGKTRLLLVDSITTIAVNIGLALWLVPRFNVIGAAVATTLTVVILNVMALIEVRWFLKITTFRWDMLKSLAAGGCASMVGLLLLRVIHVGYGYRATFGVLALVIPFMLVYVLVLALLRLSEEDKIVFDAVRAKFGKKPSA
jgi:O-antigen/teichoic acid export membrane protein